MLRSLNPGLEGASPTSGGRDPGACLGLWPGPRPPFDRWGTEAYRRVETRQVLGGHVRAGPCPPPPASLFLVIFVAWGTHSCCTGIYTLVHVRVAHRRGAQEAHSTLQRLGVPRRPWDPRRGRGFLRGASSFPRPGVRKRRREGRGNHSFVYCFLSGR